MGNPVIYKIQSPSGKAYIGQSWCFKHRMSEHRNTERTNHPLYASIGKYGFDNHEIKILHILPLDVPQEIMDLYEQIYMDAYREAGFKLMNLREAGSNGKLHPDVIARMTLIKIGKKQSAETIEKRVSKLRGRKLSPEIIKRMSANRKVAENIGAWNRGIIRTDENKKRISDTLKSRTDNKGENHNMAKLTNEIVLEIRSKYKPKGVYPTRRLAEEYNISNTNVKDIINNKIWKNI